MPPIQRKIVRPTKELPSKEVEIDEEDEELEEDDIAVDETEEQEDIDETEETVEETYEGLPDVTLPIGAPNEGFDYFDTVHSDLKAAGYVANKAQTKELIKYFNQMMFFNAFENGRHDIDGLGTVFSDIKPAKEMTATSTFGGKTVGEKYTVDAKHFFGFKMSGKAKTILAEISDIEGWSPEEILELINAGSEEDAE